MSKIKGTIDYSYARQKLVQLKLKLSDLERQIAKCKDDEIYSKLFNEINNIELKIESEESIIQGNWQKDVKTHNLVKRSYNKDRMEM